MIDFDSIEDEIKQHETSVETRTFRFPFQVLKANEVVKALGISRSTFYEMQNPENPRFDPEFPQPLRWGNRSTRWRADEITAWMVSRPRTRASKSDT